METKQSLKIMFFFFNLNFEPQEKEWGLREGRGGDDKKGVVSARLLIGWKRANIHLWLVQLISLIFKLNFVTLYTSYPHLVSSNHHGRKNTKKQQPNSDIFLA